MLKRLSTSIMFSIIGGAVSLASLPSLLFSNDVIAQTDPSTSLSRIVAPKMGGVCLNVANVDGKGPQPGAPVVVSPCAVPTASNEKFQLASDGTIRTPLYGNLCLEVKSKQPQPEAPVRVMTCKKGAMNQQFKLAQDGSGTLTAPSWGGVCLGIPSGEIPPKAGTQVIAATCVSNYPQLFWSQQRVK